jgi:hypothetical protein
MEIINNEWVQRNGHFGVINGIARKLLEESKVFREAKSKKLFLKLSRS